MIETIFTFSRRHVFANWRRIIETSHPYIAGVVALVVSFNFWNIGKHFSIDNNFTIFINYDTVVFGFTATAMAITLTVSSDKFLKFLSSHIIDGRTAYRSAVFVLAWNSLVHSSAFFMLLVTKNAFFYDPTTQITTLGRGEQIALFLSLWVQVYAFFQFVVTNITLFEVSDLFGMFLQREAARESYNADDQQRVARVSESAAEHGAGPDEQPSP